jgi:tetratricopeptide (TPR) repeat protein
MYKLAALAVFIVALVSPVFAADDAAARSQFESILKGLNENSFDRFDKATDDAALQARIFGNRVIESDVKRAFIADFDANVAAMFKSSFPESRGEIVATLVDFRLQGGEGRAVVRFESPGYRYSYHVYELRLDPRGRLFIADWIDYYQGNRFSDEAGMALVMAMPSKPATRNLLKSSDPDEAAVFQASELFKAVRDKNVQRFFQIFDGLDEALRNNPVLVRLNLQLSMQSRDRARIEAAERRLTQVFPDDALHSLRLLEYYLPARQYTKAIDALVRLQNELDVIDGATESLKAMAALADGDLERAEEFALRATQAEPALEVSWWSLLRVRTRAENFAGTTEALSRLESDFGRRLGPEKLKKDPFLRVLADRKEYLDWRAAND